MSTQEFPPPGEEPRWGQQEGFPLHPGDTRGSVLPPAPPPPHKSRKRLWISLAVLGAALLLFGGCTAAIIGALSGPTASVADKATAPTEATSAPPEEETESTEAPEPTKPQGPAKGKVGDTMVMTDGFGDKALEVTVAATPKTGGKGIRFSKGDEYSKPDQGWYLGVYVKTKAFQDGQNSGWGDLYVIQAGERFEGTGCCPDGFTPELDYVDLNKGEHAEGWILFDVPRQHGKVIFEEGIESKVLAEWSF